MNQRTINWAVVGASLSVLLLAGCARRAVMTGAPNLHDALRHYAARQGQSPPIDESSATPTVQVTRSIPRLPQSDPAPELVFTLGMMPQEAASRPAARDGGLPEGYWREDVWHQAGDELHALFVHDFWHGLKTSFWDLDNALLLTAAMGASVAIRETGVDDTVRDRVHRHEQLGDFDEPIQILGNPGTHFAATGVLWLSSTLLKDARQHELAKTLTQALAVTGATTLALKVAANTHAPNGEPYAWPSGHTSSSFAVAAVLNEYYGPWVGVPSFALAGLVGYQRLDSRVHDFSDVVFGAMLGYVVGTSIARDQKAQFPELFGMTVVPLTDPQTGAAGIALIKSW